MKMVSQQSYSSRRCLDYPSVCDGNLLKMIDSYSSAIRTSRECILFPLLATVSGIMKGSTVQINEMWQERCTLWCVLGARRCSKKTTILNEFSQALHTTETEMSALGSTVNTMSDMEDVINKSHCDTLQNKGSILLQEDLSFLTEPENACKQGVIKKLFDTSWEPGEGMSIGGFMSKDKISSFLNNDPLQIADRFLIAVPTDIIYKPSECKVPMPSNTPRLSDTFKVVNLKHTEVRNYTLSTEAQAMFDAVCDRYREQMEKYAENENKYATYSRAPSLLARLSVTITCLRQALKYVVYHEDVDSGSWCTVISREDLESSQSILQWVIDTKHALFDQIEQQGQPGSFKMNGTPEASSSLGQRESAEAHAHISLQKRRISKEQENEIGTLAAKRLRGTGTTGPQISPPHHQHGPIPSPLVIASVCSQVSQAQPTFESAVDHDQRRHLIPGSVHLAHIPNGSSAKSTSPPIHPEVVANKRGHQYMPSMGPFITNDAILSSENSEIQDSMESYPLHHLQQQHSFQQQQSQSPPSVPPHISDLGTFLANYSHKIKKFLEFKLDYRVSPSMAAQRHIIPPLTREEMQQLNTMNRYPVIAAREFLHKVALLGFGHMEYGTISHNRASMFFVKFPYQDLGDKARQLLSSLGVHPVDYNAAFTFGNGGTVGNEYKSPENFVQDSLGMSPENLHEDGRATVKIESS